MRACYNRVILAGHDGQGKRQKLFNYLRSLPPQGKEKSKKVFDNAQGAAREVCLAVSFAPVTLLPPHVRKGEYENKPLLMWAVRVFEANPPAGTTGLEWFLTTLEPVRNLDQAWEKSKFYECRFVVEEYHKAQKTGCQIEDLQFETAQALQPMIALLSVVAVLLLNLRIACRQSDADTRKATEMVDQEYEEILRAWRYPKPRGAMSIREFYMAHGSAGRPHESQERWLAGLADPVARLDQAASHGGRCQRRPSATAKKRGVTYTLTLPARQKREDDFP